MYIHLLFIHLSAIGLFPYCKWYCDEQVCIHMSFLLRMLLKIRVFMSLERYLGVELLAHKLALFLVIFRNLLAFFIDTGPIVSEDFFFSTFLILVVSRLSVASTSPRYVLFFSLDVLFPKNDSKIFIMYLLSHCFYSWVKCQFNSSSIFWWDCYIFN